MRATPFEQPQQSPMVVRVPRWAYPLVTLLSLLLGVTDIVRGTRAVVTVVDSDLTNFFFKSADYILRGDPWHIYAAHGSSFTSTYPNYNPPLSIFLMAPLLQLARSLGFAANYGEQITVVSLPFIILVPILGFLCLRVLDRLNPAMPDAQRLLVFALITLSPLTWQSYSPWYHLEQPLMLCLLVASVLALQSDRTALGGLLAGLAVLTRTTALMPILALGVLLLVHGAWRKLITYGGIGALVTLVGVAPFFLAYPRDTLYALVTWRGTASIGGNSIWTIFAAGNNATGIRHLADAAARRLDMYTVLLVLVVVALLAARRLRVTAEGADAWAVLAIAALTVPMLSKTNWPYYYLEPFVLLVIWEFATMHDRVAGLWRWPVLSIAYLCVSATLSQYIGLASVGALDRISVGVLEFVAMAGFAVAIWRRMSTRKPSQAATSGTLDRAATVGAAQPGVRYGPSHGPGRSRGPVAPTNGMGYAGASVPPPGSAWPSPMPGAVPPTQGYTRAPGGAAEPFGAWGQPGTPSQQQQYPQPQRRPDGPPRAPANDAWRGNPER